MSKPTNSHVFNARCAEELNTVGMLGRYRTYLSGLDEADLAAVKAGSNAAWFAKVTAAP
jgi:hypothetical protein